jgi:hypothetical protein
VRQRLERLEHFERLRRTRARGERSVAIERLERLERLEQALSMEDTYKGRQSFGSVSCHLSIAVYRSRNCVGFNSFLRPFDFTQGL